MKDFSIRESKIVYQGRLVAVAALDVEGPSGEVVVRESVVHPGAVVVLPVYADHTVILCRQYRAPIDDYLLEAPAGKLNPGEDPVECAKRELVEETGLKAGYLTKLATFYTSPGFTNEIMHAFLARELSLVGRGELDARGIEERHLELVRVPLRDWPRLIEEGTIRDAKSIVTLTLAARTLGIEG